MAEDKVILYLENEHISPHSYQNNTLNYFFTPGVANNPNFSNNNSSLHDFTLNPIKLQNSVEFPDNFNSYKSPINEQQVQKQSNISNELFEIEKKRKKQKYKRSTNNSHKKFISAIRRLFFAVISIKQKEYFQTKYSKYRSCRTFFFIILAYMKHRFSQKLLNSVKASFINEMNIKINQYQQQINRTKNINLKNFRQEQIVDIKYSIKSCNQYFNGNTRQAIECMYKKDKSTVIKRQHYESALRSVHMIQKELSKNPKQLLEEPYIQDYSYSSDKEKIRKKNTRRPIRQPQFHHFSLPTQKIEMNDQNRPTLDEDQKNKILKPTHNDEKSEISLQKPQQSQSLSERFLYPPLLQSIPFVSYNPFNPPYVWPHQRRIEYDVREDFFGFMRYGFPRFYPRGYG